MKAIISNLWGSPREVISFDNDGDYPSCISDLKKCDNVIVGTRVEGPRSPYEVLINDNIFMVMPVKLRHPSGCGTLYVLEVY
jgi:hypothetical protein